MMRILITFLLVANISIAQANEYLGQYTAVTESELILMINILPGNKAEFITGIYTVEDHDKEWQKNEKAKWTIDNNTILIKIDSGEFIKYQITDCLSYSEFGYKGCSFGLKPIDSSYERNGVIMKNSLWKKKKIDKLLGKKP